MGFAWNVGHALTFKVLTDDTQKVLCRSQLWLAKDGENNLKLDVEAGAAPERTHIHSKHDKDGDDIILPMIDLTNNPFDIKDVVTEQGETENTEGETGNAGTMNGPTSQETLLGETVEYEEDPKPSTGGTTNFDADFLKMDAPTQPDLPLEEMINRTFLIPPKEDGSRVRAKIIEHVNQHKDGLILR